jgi:hypothetical protein
VGGSSKKATVGYKYHLGVLFGLWKGPIDEVRQIAVDGRTAWPAAGTEPAEPINIDAEDLFGGEAREGGISGAVDIDYGYPTQTTNAYLVSKLGAQIPAFRGITTAVLNQCYMGNNPYLKPWSFRGERIHIRQDGIAQWYDEKAEIPSLAEYYDGSAGQDNITCLAVDDLYQNINYSFSAEFYNPAGANGATYASPNGPVVATISGVSETDVFVVVKRAHSVSHQRAYVMGWAAIPSPDVDGNSIPDGSLWATNRFFVTTPDDESTLYWPQAFDDSGTAETYALAQGTSCVLTGYTDYKLWLWDDINISGGDINPSGGGTFYAAIYQADPTGFSCFAAYDCSDMNPAHIIRECLTDPDWGMGYNDSDIDDTSFMAAADALYVEVFGLSITWTRESPLIDFVSEILRHIDGVLYVDRQTGKFALKLVRNDYSVSQLLILDESNVAKVSGAKRPAVADLVSSVTVNYYDRGTGEDGSVTRHNQSLLQTQQGSGSAATIAYPAITSGPLADRVCQRDLVALSTPLLSCQIEVWRIAEELNIGDAFILDWPDHGIDGVIMRVQQMTLGDDQSQTIVIDALEDVFALPGLGEVGGNKQPGIWTDPIAGTVLEASPRVITEVPYYELARGLGAGYVSDVLTLDPDAGFLLAAAGRQGTETNARMAVDSGAGYEDADVLDFCPVAYLSADAGITDTILYLTGEVDIDLIDVGDIAQIGDELVRIDLVDQDSTGQYLLTVGRGVLDTVPAEHAATDGVVVWGFDWTGDSIQYTASDALDVRLRPQLGSSVLAVADAPIDTVTMDSRAVRPYPPGDLQIDGSSYPPLSGAGLILYSASHALTWKHRDRLQQTAGTIEDYTATDIGPEAGTTYRVDVYATMGDGSIDLYQTVGAITTNYYTITTDPVPAGAATVHFTVTSVRGGYDAWQSPACYVLPIFPGQTRTLQDGTNRTLEDGTTRVTES